VGERLGNLGRAILRSLARPFLPAKWRTVVDLIAAPIPSTPHVTVPAPNDAAVRRLEAIDHIVVVMLENRSFDHMLGYLSLPPDLGGRERGDVDGLRGPEVNFNENDGQRYPIHRLTATKFKDETEDPDHSGPSVDEQLSGNCEGFVRNFARVSSERAKTSDEAPPCQGDRESPTCGNGNSPPL